MWWSGNKLLLPFVVGVLSATGSHLVDAFVSPSGSPWTPRTAQMQLPSLSSASKHALRSGLHRMERAPLDDARAHSCSARLTSIRLSAAEVGADDGANEDAAAPESPADFAGKTLYQRTFYRLTQSARVAQPNAMVIEERIRFQPDSEDTTKVRPMDTTLILREGTAEDEITDEFFRLNVSSKSANERESIVTTALFLASNPQVCQGNMLQLACGGSAAAATVLGCIGAGFALRDKDDYAAKKKALKQLQKQSKEGSSGEGDSTTGRTARIGDGSGRVSPLQIKMGDDMLPPSLGVLTLSDETSSALQQALATVKGARLTPGKVTIQELLWSRRPGMGMVSAQRQASNSAYRTIVGCDIPYSFPSAKELSRCIAHALLPSDLVAQAQVEAGSAGAASAGSSNAGGGFLGMDEVAQSASPAASDAAKSAGADVDTSVPPAFIHVAPERSLTSSEDSIYLRQFLEQGYRMDVSTQYFRVERLSFQYQTLDTLTPTSSDEAGLEDLDLELLDEATPSYQSLIAVHHPDYAGDGSGELFFPMENGAYQGGSRGAGTYLEPETEGGSFLM